MGSGMLKNLNTKFDVKAYDVLTETRNRYKNEGFNIVDDISELVLNPEIN